MNVNHNKNYYLIIIKTKNKMYVDTYIIIINIL